MPRKAFISSYRQCPDCKTVLFDPKRELSQLSVKTSCCGSFGKARIIWPSIIVHKYLELVNNLDPNSEDDQKISVVFLSSAFEMMLEDILWELLFKHTPSPLLADSIMDSFHGKERRIKLFDSISDNKFSEITKDDKEFTERWNEITFLRNRVAHGDYFVSSKKYNEVESIDYLYDNCLKYFSKIENEVQSQKAFYK
jgi:hypothetical protein